MRSLNVSKGLASALLVMTAHAALSTTAVEYYNPDLDNFFITADPAEQRFVDGGTVGLWQRTGNTFPTGGPGQVCRFYGSALGPNSHFYTVDAGECAYLKSIYNPAEKSWKFESNDFSIAGPSAAACPAGLFPVYRAYNKGAARGIDSNHRITNNPAAIQEVVGRGWISEGIVMCSPQIGTTNSTPTCPAPQVVQNDACAASCTAPLVAKNGYCVIAPAGVGNARNYWRFEDTGLVILNDNANTQRFTISIDSFDLNGDGVNDSITVGPEFEINPSYPPGPLPISAFKRQSAHVLLGGAVTTSGAAFFPSGRPSYVVSGWPLSYDFNGDGRRDIFIPDEGPDAPPFPGEQSRAWLSGPAGWGPATMQSAVVSMHGASAGRIAGQPVIFANVICCGADQVPFLYVFRNGTFVVDRSLLPSLVTDSIAVTAPGEVVARLVAKRWWTSSAIVDVDGDGIDDLVLGNFFATSLNDPLIGNYIVFGTGGGWQSGAIVRLPDPQGDALTTLTMLSIRAVDIDGDGRKDLVIGYTAKYSTRGIQILRNNGDRTFTDTSGATLGADAYVAGNPSGKLYAVDLNNDGCIDLIEPEPQVGGGASPLGRILLNDCQGKFINANSALASVLGELPGYAVILPFTDYTGRTSFYVPTSEPPSATSGGLHGTRYRKLKNLRNLPTPVNGTVGL